MEKKSSTASELMLANLDLTERLLAFDGISEGMYQRLHARILSDHTIAFQMATRDALLSTTDFFFRVRLGVH